MAAERAGFLYEMRGLDEDTLCTVTLDDGWTTRDMFPHLGYWDAFYADRIQRLLGGRRHEIQPLEDDQALDRLNAETRRQFSHLGLAEAVAIAVKERNGFLATLAQTTDNQLYRRVQLGPDWRTSVATWTRWRYQHDAAHAAEIGRWRRRYRTNRGEKSPASKVILRPFLSASRQEFMSLAALIGSEERNKRPVCGHWTLRDVIGHLTTYEFMGVTALKDLAGDETPQFSKTIRNFNTFNEAQVVARRSVDWAPDDG